MVLKVDFKVLRLGPNAQLLLLMDHFEPHSYHAISRSAGKGIEQKTLRVNRISELETGPWTPDVKSIKVHPRGKKLCHAPVCH